jgi:hypothetical protein
MTDTQFTDEEIIKALELCNKPADPEICENCPFCSDFKCLYILKANALKLINRQKAEIEKLENARQKQAQFLSEERGQKYELIDKLSQVKAEAYKEFAERLKEKKLQSTLDARICTTEMIENLLKEMVGENE